MQSPQTKAATGPADQDGVSDVSDSKDHESYSSGSQYSGSSIDAADINNHFPGADLVNDDEPSSTLASATGAPFSSNGKFNIPSRTSNGHT